MALFNRRKKDTDVLPEEVREYYQSERRERAGVAWMLALGTLVLTFVIAASLFFGGRWAYNTVFNNDKDSDSNQTASQDDGLRVDESGNVTGGTTQDTSNGSTGTSSTSTTTPGTATTPSTSSSTPATTPSTGDATPAQLIDTGPGDE